MTTRREFLDHARALGLGAAFFPAAAAVRRAGAAEEFSAANRPAGLIFETIESGGIAHYSYFIGDALSGQAVVIDPRRDVEIYVELARKHRLAITHAVDTHIHADFVSGGRELADRTGAKFHGSVEGDAKYGYPVEPIRHGDELKIGGVVLKAIHSPGHTPEHMSYLATTQGRADRAWALFTGDFLFAGAVGRPDLMGVENTDRLAHLLFATLQTAYKALPDALPIHPAHGPGSPCGAGILAREGTATLGLERATNPALQIHDETAFIADLLFKQPPIPYYWPRMKKVNAQGPEVLKRLPVPKPMKPKEFEKLVADKDVQLLDVRDYMAFGGGHVPGALNVGYSSKVSTWGGWLLDPARPIALVVPKEGKVGDVVAWLVRVGLTDFAGVLEGGMDAWVEAGKDFATIDQMTVGELDRRMKSGDDLVLLDVRQPSEWDQGHVPGARYLFLPEIPAKAGELDRSKPVAAFCHTGYRAGIAASILKREGFDVSNVPGSFGAWMAAGYDVDVPAKPGKASDTHRSA